jgi:hypothetical protein
LVALSGGFVQVALADEREGEVTQHDGLGLGVIAESKTRGTVSDRSLQSVPSVACQ